MPIATKANCNPKVTRNRSGNIISSIVSFINCLKYAVVFISLSSFRLKCCASQSLLPTISPSFPLYLFYFILPFVPHIRVLLLGFFLNFFRSLLLLCTFSSFVIPTGRHILEMVQHNLLPVSIM